MCGKDMCQGGKPDTGKLGSSYIGMNVCGTAYIRMRMGVWSMACTVLWQWIEYYYYVHMCMMVMVIYILYILSKTTSRIEFHQRQDTSKNKTFASVPNATLTVCVCR